ncbi:unnamed protein product [Strongylus vulgaris]|uniref:Uncharacterized protein n=1 Tax=Strongylus vulgaris TaxID=40348 RepID=A0A3P7JMI2_STRVU|nr:unnamed protein product [Strongylus vulgaris]
MLNSWYRNESESSICLNVSASEFGPSAMYYIPPYSTFHIGPAADIQNFAALNDETFDLVVMDPPWENLSVKRQQSYVTCDSAINVLDLNYLASSGLVTMEGAPICSFNGSHKLPYEKLVIASPLDAVSHYPAIIAADGKVFASIPMAVPSRKPPVVPILKQFGFRPNCIPVAAAHGNADNTTLSRAKTPSLFYSHLVAPANLKHCFEYCRAVGEKCGDVPTDA